ncbi:TPA: hypothetical protein I8Y95_000557 [Legionella pneumophila]|uniref:hypothetical protein n=1 Tax=Legionella pneumophila TaxID=446 RepID=UPI000770881F|nr:hypothetical protein [Legionella pneumophila]MCH9125733.1 hypothetical protein [Legionella pneumophila serogroup 1]MCH9161280.1 hypothetical protein [Legionella pneumophila serogroup 1]MCH9167604.1 hypothetical protein [Legionella pneumophila serogroup 1]MCH9176201.1 hypothetical protein [Legionella pneumophila serogroup 1]MCH9179497.1 hypothetical protein [Legionella pneumophila serogroup 1]
MKYILLLLFNISYAPNHPVVTTSLEFSTQQACEDAGKQVQELTRTRNGSAVPDFICLKK